MILKKIIAINFIQRGCFIILIHILLGCLLFSFNSFIIEILISDFPLRLNLLFLVDSKSLIFRRVVLFISRVVIFYSNVYSSGDLFHYRFIILILLFVYSILLLIFRMNLISLIIGWDGLGLTSFLLVIYYQNNNSLRSGLLTIYINRVGDVAILFSIYVHYSYMFRINVIITNYDEKINIKLYIFMLILAGMTKRAQFPFSAWLPAAIAAPTPVSSLVHSSTLVTAGVYLLIRFYWVISTSILIKFLMYTSLFTIFYSGLVAAIEIDIKKVIAISTLSQLALIIFVVSTGEIEFSFYHLINHALFKALLFLRCGISIIRLYGNQDARNRAGITKNITFIPFFFVISNINLIGFPFISAFYSKDLMIEATWGLESNIIIFFFFFLSCILSVVYRYRLIVIGINNFRSKINLNYWQDSWKTYLPIRVMFIWSVLIGSFLRNILYSDYLFVNYIVEKIYGIYVLCGGGVIAFFLMEKKYIKNLFIIRGDIIFINYFSSKISSLLPHKINITEFDIFWLELFGPKGMSNLLINFKKFNTILLFKIMIVIFMFILFFLLFYTLKLYEHDFEEVKVIQ